MARALITGGTGYVGSRLARHLLEAGWDVAAVVRPDSDRRRLPDGVTCHVHDRSAACMTRILRDAAPDVLFHLASRTQPWHSIENMDDIVAANIGFGAQLLEAMASADVRCLIEAGTNWEFDAAGHFRPNTFYAATKQAFRVLADYYVQRHGFSVTTLLLYDVYGPDDWRGKFLSHLVNALKRNETMAATPGEQIVEFVHVDDVGRGFLLAAKELLRADARVQAHHSFAATYFEDQTESIEGNLVQFLFRNPHSFVHVEAKDKEGAVQRYAVEWGAGGQLNRQGVTRETLHPGDHVIVTGNPGRNPADHRLRMKTITRPSDGWKWGGTFD